MKTYLESGLSAAEKQKLASLEREEARLKRMIGAEEQRRTEIQKRLEREIRRIKMLRH